MGVPKMTCLRGAGRGGRVRDTASRDTSSIHGRAEDDLSLGRRQSFQAAGLEENLGEEGGLGTQPAET